MGTSGENAESGTEELCKYQEEAGESRVVWCPKLSAGTSPALSVICAKYSDVSTSKLGAHPADSDAPSNLSLACISCNLHKGQNLTGIDPDDCQIVELFHPRYDIWDAHFERYGAPIVGHTPTGRATVVVLNINDPENANLRAKLLADGKLD